MAIERLSVKRRVDHKERLPVLPGSVVGVVPKSWDCGRTFQSVFSFSVSATAQPDVAVGELRCQVNSFVDCISFESVSPRKFCNSFMGRHLFDVFSIFVIVNKSNLFIFK